MLQPTYAPESTVLGVQPSFGLGFGYGRNITRADLSVSLRGIELTRSDTVWGWTDVSPFVGIAWSRGVHNWIGYLTGNIPVGSYDSDRLSNFGIGHAVIDAGGGYTYLNQATGRESSAVTSSPVTAATGQRSGRSSPGSRPSVLNWGTHSAWTASSGTPTCAGTTNSGRGTGSREEPCS